MKVLSLFDWCGCAYQALKNLKIPVDAYYAAEVDKYAMHIAKKNHPDIVHIWDVRWINFWCDWSLPWFYDWRFFWVGDHKIIAHCTDIDLLIWWPPCQDLSIAGKRKWLDWERSGLFREYVRILRAVRPKYFLMENVASMSKENRDIITKELWVEPIMMNSALVTAQNRKRLYRTNIPNVVQPDDRHIYLKDIVHEYTEVDREKSYAIDANYQKWGNREQYKKWWKRQMVVQKIGNIHPSGRWMNGNVYSLEWKSPTITTNKGEWPKIVQRARWFNKGWEYYDKSPTLWSSFWQENNKLHDWYIIRKLTPIECERLQGMPDNYTQGVSNAQRYKMIGNGFTVPVIQHILSFIPSHVTSTNAANTK